MLAIFLAVIVGTWNGNWFPSGRAEHRAHPAVEAATIAAVGEMLKEGIKVVDPSDREDVILCLCEIRNREVAEKLAAAIGREGLKVASISGYRRRDRFDQQQNVILTTLPVVEAKWAKWSSAGRFTPPRGYAFAALKGASGKVVRVYAVHLKSNYGATIEKNVEENRGKRTTAIRQFLEHEQSETVILAGDFNADRWRKEFENETIFTSLAGAGYANLLELLPPEKRGTHPHKRYGDSALDYIFAKGLSPCGLPHIQPSEALSDHYALFAAVEL